MTSDISALRNNLVNIADQNAKIDWKYSLSERKRIELEFHNRDRDKALTESLPQDTYELLHGNKKYYSTVELSTAYVNEWLAQKVKGKVFLDYACGNGKYALLAGKMGAALAIGIDISDISINNARKAAAEDLLSDKTFFMQADCEMTNLPSNSIDVILCSGMLHHLDLSYAFPELRRILRPGGIILGVEALKYNPLIRLYRALTPSMRTEWEKSHILSLKDIEFARYFFEVGSIRYWHIFSIFAGFFHKSPKLMKLFLKGLDAIDRALTRIPLVQLLAWQFTFELVKKNER